MTGTGKTISVVNENKTRRSQVKMHDNSEEATFGESPEIDSQLEEKSRHFSLLSSRLKEQSNLISILKEQIYNTEIKIASYRERNKNLDTYRNSTLSELKEQMKHYSKLKSRYCMLQNNFLEIKEITEQYKAKNKLLTDEMKALEISNDELYGTAKSEVIDQVESLKKTHSNLREQCKLIEEKICVQDNLAVKVEKELKEDTKTQKKKHKEEMENLMSRLDDIQNTSEDAEKSLKLDPKPCPKQIVLEKKLKELEKEKEEVDKELNHNEKHLELEQNENENFIKKINTLKKTISEHETQFKEKVDLVQSDSEVISLQQELKDAELSYEKTLQEIEDFKEKSRKKLERERKLNEKLRHIPG